MGLFDKKYCSICGNPLGIIESGKVKDGYVCKNCKGKLSPFYTFSSRDLIKDINYQLQSRADNEEKLKRFSPTKVFNGDSNIFVDEDRFQFAVAKSKNPLTSHADIISLVDLKNISTEIEENKQEILYQDSQGEVHSFCPQSYAYSYNFFINLETKIPYIGKIHIKLNQKPVDNDQETLINMSQNGLLNIVSDLLNKRKSFNNGQTSNANEVRSSIEYKKYAEMLDTIKTVLAKRPTIDKAIRTVPVYVKCPWCGSKVLRTNENCNHCGGPL